MTLQIDLTPDTEAKLRQRAAATGKDMAEFVVEAVEEKLSAPESLAELLAPIHTATTRSGIGGDDLDAVIEQVRDEVYAGKNVHRPA